MVTIQIVADNELLISLDGNIRCTKCHGKGTRFSPGSNIDPYGPCLQCDGRGYFEE